MELIKMTTTTMMMMMNCDKSKRKQYSSSSSFHHVILLLVSMLACVLTNASLVDGFSTSMYFYKSNNPLTITTRSLNSALFVKHDYIEGENNDDDDDDNDHERMDNTAMTSSSSSSSSYNSSRRQWMKQTFGWTLSAGAVLSLSSSSSSSSLSVANAACLPGDLRTECIGVYKVPIDASVLPYVGTPEALQRFAPDLKYIPPIASPNSFDTAMEILQTQRLAADDIQQVVLSGKLEEAGIKVLNLIPKITSSGRYIVDTIQGDLSGKAKNNDNNAKLDTIRELRMSQLEDQFNMMIGLWGGCDVEIGQGLRGQMGVSAAAQIQILSSIRDAIASMDDFLATVASTQTALKQ